MKPRRKYLHIYRTRHNRIIYYYRRPYGKRIRLPDDYGSESFWASYQHAADGYPAPPPKKLKLVFSQTQKQRVGKAVENMLRAAKRRAIADGQAFDLDREWALETIAAQGFRCGLTGVPFYAKIDSRCRVHPFGPSFDRIEPGGGYTRGNVRIVLYAVNVMLMDWGEGVFSTVVNHYRTHKWQKSKILSANFFKT